MPSRTPMLSNCVVRRRSVVTLVVVVGSLLTSGTAGRAVALFEDEADAGAVDVVEAYAQSKELTHGNSETEFSLRLPDGATCPGDSANDQWRVDSFIVPATDDPSKIRYGAIGPEPVGNGRYAMFGVDTVPYVFQLTLRNPGPGRPGLIPTMPPFSLAVVAGEHIPSGTYRVGIACTDLVGDTKKFWDTEIVLAESSASKPGHLTWRLSDVPETVFESDTKSSGSIIGLAIGALGAAAVVAMGVFAWRRRARSSLTLSKEHS